MRKNTIAPMIIILDRSELDTEVLDTDMETMESDDCRGAFSKNRNTNGVLATTQEVAKFLCKDEQKFINLFI